VRWYSQYCSKVLMITSGCVADEKFRNPARALREDLPAPKLPCSPLPHPISFPEGVFANLSLSLPYFPREGTPLPIDLPWTPI